MSQCVMICCKLFTVFFSAYRPRVSAATLEGMASLTFDVDVDMRLVARGVVGVSAGVGARVIGAQMSERQLAAVGMEMWLAVLHHDPVRKEGTWQGPMQLVGAPVNQEQRTNRRRGERGERGGCKWV